MFLLTMDQERILSVLEEAGCLRVIQAARLLNDAYGAYTERVLRQLQFMQRLFRKSETVVTLPHLSDRAPDMEMISAIDIMLDIAGGSLLAVSAAKSPYKLCFLTDNESRIGSYAVAAVPIGREQLMIFHAGSDTDKTRTLILLLEDLTQREKISLSTPHFFAVFDGEYRYFEGI